MNFKQLIELIQSSLDYVQIADAIEFLGDTSTLMAELEHDHHMACIEIKKMQAEIDALKAQNAELLLHVKCCIEAYDNAIILEGGGMEDSISDARAYVEAIAKARGDQP